MSRDKEIPQVRLRTPKFKSEAEEAAWWDSHPEVILKAFERAYGKRAVERVLRGKPNPKHAPTRTVTIRLPVQDVERARRLAAGKGLGYQTLVKSLLHEALNRAERA
jgi:16S rRNA C967 or C1407 C5-methylase (RsmB/RsmF family)